MSPAAAIPPPRPAPHRARGAGHPRPPAPRAGASPAVWLAAAGVLVLLYFFRGLLLPLLLAAGLAYLLNPLIAWAQGLGVRRSVAVAGLYVVLGALLLTGVLLLGPLVRDEAAALAERLPVMADEVDAALVLAARDLVAVVPAARRILPSPEARRGFIDQLVEGRGGRLSDVVEQAGHLLLYAMLVPFFAFFLLRDTGRLLGRLLDRVPAGHIETSVAVLSEIDRIIGGYLRGVALDGIVVAAIASPGLWALGVPSPLLLGGLAGLANAVPIVGPVISAAAAGLVALTSGQGVARLGGILVLFLGIKLLDDTVIQPLTIGRSVHLHPVLLLASVVAGGQAFGILGMIVAVPATTVLQETIALWLERRSRRQAPVAQLDEAVSASFLC